jgi:hypothetical protein
MTCTRDVERARKLGKRHTRGAFDGADCDRLHAVAKGGNRHGVATIVGPERARGARDTPLGRADEAVDWNEISW